MPDQFFAVNADADAYQVEEYKLGCDFALFGQFSTQQLRGNFTIVSISYLFSLIS